VDESGGGSSSPPATAPNPGHQRILIGQDQSGKDYGLASNANILLLW
jgi:hypothetical protein